MSKIKHQPGDVAGGVLDAATLERCRLERERENELFRVRFGIDLPFGLSPRDDYVIDDGCLYLIEHNLGGYDTPCFVARLPSGF